MKTPKYLPFFFFLFSLPLFGQSTFIDSLEQLILDASYQEKVKLKYQLDPYFKSILNVDERLKESKQYVEIVTHLNDSILLDHAYWNLYKVYNQLGETEKAKQANNKNIEISAAYGCQLEDVEINDGYHYAGSYMEVYADSTKRLNLDTIRNNPNLFSTNTKTHDFDSNSVYWSKLKLRGSSNKTTDYLFQISSDRLGQKSWENIEAYLIRKDGTVETQQTGFALKQKEKAIPYPANLVRFTIAKNEIAVLYLRLEGVKKEIKPRYLGLQILDADYYLDTEGGYAFKGQFHQKYDYPYSFVSNYIYHHEIVEDTVGTMNIESVYNNWQSLDRQDWMSVQPAVDKVYWLKAKFIGSPIFNGEQVIHPTDWAANDLRSFDYVDAYIPDGKGGFHHQRTGDQVALSERPYHFWATFLKVNIPLNDTLELMVRLEGADANFLPHRILLTHIDESSIWPDQINKGLNNGIMLGILAIQCLYFLFLFFVEKNRLHLYLSIFILGIFIALAFSPANYITFAAIPIWKGITLRLNFISLFLVLFGLIKFIQVYFNYPKTSRTSKWIIPLYFSIVAILLFTQIINHELFNKGQIVFSPLIIFGVLLALFLVFTSKKQAHVSKRFFLLAFLPLLSIVAFSFIFYDILPRFLNANSTLLNYINLNKQAFTETSFYYLGLSIIFCLVMLALSAGKRTNALKAEKEKALQKNLDDQKHRLAEQQRVNKAISRFVPNEFLSALGKSDITEIGLGDTVEKEVTVFFSDIRDYTSLSEKLSPQDNFRFVNAYNGRMGPIIQNNHGFVNQYLGDGIMAIFPNSPTDALRAAIQMQLVLQRYNQQRNSQGRSTIKVGMGLHTGSLIMGITGDENRMDAATISDSVNSASRIESLSKYYGNSILLSEVTLKKIATPDEFHFRYLGKVQVKGKQKPLKIYECFDGETSDIFELKLATLPTFNAGIQHYFSQSFSQATSDFELVVKQNPDDKTAKLFLYKAKQLEEMGVTENWTGVELMTQK